MKRTIPWLLALLITTCGAWASRRGQEPRVTIALDQREAFTGEAYSLTLHAASDGFIYLYSLDPEGYVSLLYPVLDQDGRGQVRAGDSLALAPLYAGSTPGFEQLVAVHTREFRPIRASRQHFLAPDPQDLPDVNARLTRVEKELDNYATATLSVLASSVAQVADDPVEDETDDDVVDAGITIHHHVYDYWCPYCDCWHPTCTWDHCWCGWEVVDHYWGHTHYSHCLLWGSWHSWWRPPVIYIYVQGGSPWDYDTRPWRPRQDWGAHRHYSDRWRQAEAPHIVDPAAWTQPHERRGGDAPDWVNLKKRLEPSAPPPQGKPSILSTEDPKDGGPETPGNWRTRSREKETQDLNPSGTQPWRKLEDGNQRKWRKEKTTPGATGRKSDPGKPGKPGKPAKPTSDPGTGKGGEVDKPAKPAPADPSRKPAPSPVKPKPEQPKPDKPSKS